MKSLVLWMLMHMDCYEVTMLLHVKIEKKKVGGDPRNSFC